MGNHVLSSEELKTLFCEVENVLKLHLLGVISDDRKDGEKLTLAHLICGTKLETSRIKETPKKSDISDCIATTRWARI